MIIFINCLIITKNSKNMKLNDNNIYIYMFFYYIFTNKKNGVIIKMIIL